MKAIFIVSLELPEGVTAHDAATYIKHAVQVDCGNMHPSNPLFYLKRDSVKVKPYGGRKCLHKNKKDG